MNFKNIILIFKNKQKANNYLIPAYELREFSSLNKNKILDKENKKKNNDIKRATEEISNFCKDSLSKLKNKAEKGFSETEISISVPYFFKDVAQSGTLMNWKYELVGELKNKLNEQINLLETLGYKVNFINSYNPDGLVRFCYSIRVN